MKHTNNDAILIFLRFLKTRSVSFNLIDTFEHFKSSRIESHLFKNKESKQNQNDDRYLKNIRAQLAMISTGKLNLDSFAATEHWRTKHWHWKYAVSSS